MYKTLTRAKLDKDWATLPKFRHNLWTNYDDQPDLTYLVVSHSKFEVPRSEAEIFLQIRSHCTGHHTIPEIARKGGVDEGKARSILGSLVEAEVLRPRYRPIDEMSEDEIREVLFAACRIWGEQLAETYVAADIQAGKLSREIVTGWLLETYHYIRAFPGAIAHAARHAEGELRDLLEVYADQERGHEAYVLQCLTNLGFKSEEVMDSIPLVSTQLIDMLMRELFTDAPAAALLVAAVVEAGEVEESEAGVLRKAVERHYGIPAEALQPLEEHMMIDSGLGHRELAEKHPHLIRFEGEDRIHNLVNRMHDIKHAFDLQSLEIKDYYSHKGNYVPRQFVDFFAV